jgi:fumarate reductase subunit C
VNAAEPRVSAEQSPVSAPQPRPYSSARFESRLWLAQRVSAMVLAVCVLVHLITIVLAVRGGLSAAEILGRLRASPLWLAFYLVFVASVAVHAPLGLRAIVAEWVGWRGRFLNAGIFMVGTVLLALGLRAIAGLFGGAA